MNKSTSDYSRRLAVLQDAARSGLLATGGRGIEKESLRVRADGTLSRTPHPSALGAALTHPEVTTDYSEALLEFITPPDADPVNALSRLHTLHAFVHQRLGGELLWDLSMPGVLPRDADIPIADYGRSNQGRFKHVYRQGLAVRYGRAMQCIAGIHYNFSLPDALWAPLVGVADNAAPPHDTQSEGYIRLMRNYRRFSWLLLYLFGASPTLDRSFFAERINQQTLAVDKGTYPGGLALLDEQTLYLPYATSLRMSDLGYHNEAMRERRPDFVSLARYIQGLEDAIAAPYAPYAAIGTHRDGKWIQLNTNLLQIENELYATVRPKRVGAEGERVVHALSRAGIQYIEIRCLDLNPYDPIGIDESTTRFLDAFLVMCALEDSPDDEALQREADANFLAVARDGRRPGKQLQRSGETVTLQGWAEALLDQIGVTAALLDDAGQHRGGLSHVAALQRQRQILASPETLPSARVLDAVRTAGSYAAFGLRQSQAHAALFMNVPLDAACAAALDALALASIEKQQHIEAADDIDFDTFVHRFGKTLNVTAG
ncbi:glutamate--cysteine ligase [Robbsia andropogonis]|uniref:glutamate--cysteine ligase n=1 Tax=Robbsia andropogonis TaxID=28092 RepID=UPI000466A97D|nr:glutamate--cysteine ligase [Robbsia andropogonis]